MGICWPNCMRRRPQRRIVLILIGLDNAGKTQTINSLAGTDESLMPTVGFKAVNLVHREIPVTIYDLGGGPQIRNIWSQYYSEIHGVIFVVDSSDPTRLEECRQVLEEVVSHERIAGKPILILANKQDKRGALDDIDVVERMSIERLVNKFRCPTLVESYTASVPEYVSKKKRKLDPGLKKGYAWLLNYIVYRYGDLNLRVQTDINAELERRKRQLAANHTENDPIVIDEETTETGFANPNYTLTRETPLENGSKRNLSGVLVVKPKANKSSDDNTITIESTSSDMDDIRDYSITVENLDDNELVKETVNDSAIENVNDTAELNGAFRTTMQNAQFKSTSIVTNAVVSGVKRESTKLNEIIKNTFAIESVQRENVKQNEIIAADNIEEIKPIANNAFMIADKHEKVNNTIGNINNKDAEPKLSNLFGVANDRVLPKIPPVELETRNHLTKLVPMLRSKIFSAVERRTANKHDFKSRPQSSPTKRVTRVDADVDVNRVDDSSFTEIDLSDAGDSIDDRLESALDNRRGPANDKIAGTLPVKPVTSDGLLLGKWSRTMPDGARPASASQLVRRQLEAADGALQRRRFSLRHGFRNKTTPEPLALFHYEPGARESRGADKGDLQTAVQQSRVAHGDITL